MPETLTQPELTREGCGVEGCGHDHDHSILYFASRCHMGGAGLDGANDARRRLRKSSLPPEPPTDNR